VGEGAQPDARASLSSGLSGTPHLLTPRQVNELLRGAIHKHLPATLHVVGQIADCMRPASGHLYCTLKGDQSELRFVMWRSAAERLRFRPEAGMEVIATGSLEVYTPRGTYQLIAQRLEPRGMGALELALRQLRETLAREGLLDASRKRALPRVPRRVAIITSPTGAALRDILRTFARRFPGLDVLLFPVRVQGEGAAEDLAAALRRMNDLSDALGGIDVAIVARGGGSAEDLWAFNQEIVARAVATSAIPIVSGVGHEIDVTLCDLVADVRAATPTAAAELVSPLRSELLAAIERQQRRAARIAAHVQRVAGMRLHALLASPSLSRPLGRLREQAQLLDERLHRLARRTAPHCARERARLHACELAVLRFGSGAAFGRLARRLDGQASRAARVLKERLWAARGEVDRRLEDARRTGPEPRLSRQDERLNNAHLRLERAARLTLAQRREMLARRMEVVSAFDPRQVLRRGFSITRDARSRAVLRSIADVRAGRRIITELADGEFRSTADDRKQPRLFE
jgi:exodeoxyribonuclease VII large subunit